MFKVQLATCISIAVGSVCAAAYGQDNAAGSNSAYPVRPVRIVVGLPPGGGIDVFMRGLGQRFSEKWGRPVVIENRVGAANQVAMEVVAKATPDGYTLLAGTSGVMMNMILKKVPFDIRTTYDPVVELASQPYLLLANNGLPAGSVKDLIALAKSKPGSLNYASSGIGSLSHMGMELLKYKSGVDILHVPYKGIAPAVTDLLAGRIQILFGVSNTAGPLIKNGNVKALAVTSPQRSKTFPDLPTIAESGVKDFSVTNSYSLYAPGKTPPAILGIINRTANQVVATPEMQTRLQTDGMESAAPNTPADFRNALSRNIATLDQFVKVSGFKGE